MLFFELTKFFGIFFADIVKKVYFCSVKRTILLYGLLFLAVTGYGLPVTGEIRSLRCRYATETGDGLQATVGDPVRVYLVKKAGEDIGAEGDAYGRVVEVSFDEMSHGVKQYSYGLRHLNADGSESGLASYEYVGGFTKGEITNYEHSLNTSELYTHYWFDFPNEDMVIKASGNYELTVYEDGDESKEVAKVVVSVVEPLAKIEAKVRADTDIELNKRYQQLDITLNVEGLTFNGGPMTDYFIVVKQNGRSDNMAFKPKATFVESNRLRWTNCRELIYEGGNEYRHFDTYSTYFAGMGVDRIVHDRNAYHAILNAEPFRGERAYMHEYDVDGQFVINAERTIYDIDTEAEYMWVHWCVPAESPWFDGAVYVGGDLFDNKLTAANRMQWDNERSCYWLTALVKQGGYDYQYWFVESRKSKVESQKIVTLQRTEGSHWETENEYMIYVYYRPFGSRADRLVGLQVIRSNR